MYHRQPHEYYCDLQFPLVADKVVEEKVSVLDHHTINHLHHLAVCFSNENETK